MAGSWDRRKKEDRKDRAIFKDILDGWIGQFKITEDQLRKILEYCFDMSDLEIHRHTILGMSMSVFRAWEQEVFKSIRRMLPKLNELDDMLRIKYLRKREMIMEYYEFEGEMSMFGLAKQDGVWRQMDELSDTKSIEKEDE